MFCILITGMPGSGKSTFANEISHKFDIPVYSKDGFKEVLFDTLGFNSREEKVKLGIAATELMYSAAEELMKHNKVFILDNNFENTLTERLDILLDKYRYTAITVRLTGDPKVIYERFSYRDLNTNRHRGHVVNDRYPEKQGSKKANPTRKTYEQYLKDIKERGFSTFASNGPVIDVDVTDLEKVDYNLLNAKLKTIIKSHKAG
ncbi:MAG TPA: AAA family ATPase [Bacilli bacterium]|jgi:adenylate kinase family enzyme|nr:AAA family ATPase [Bacilli bacterium]HOH68145.1 AAA family ATPase [Bacilli bacterium]